VDYLSESWVMATIKDVAKKAGVSVSTASYALNNVPHVHPETRKRVLEIAASINYHPSASARNLKTKRTNNIGVFVYGFSGPVFSEILEGINHVVHQHGLNILVSSGKSSSIMLKEKQVDAAIIFDSSFDRSVIMQYAKLAPVVVLDTYLKGKNIYASVIDNDLLVHQLIRQMINQGYQQFVYVAGPKDAFNNKERYKGYLQALQEANLKSLRYFSGDFTIPSGYQAGQQIVKMKPLPDFVYCANDEMALGVIQALHEANIAIPNTIGVAGFDGSYLNNQYIKPSLTTITINHYAWGQSSALFLIQALQKGEPIKGVSKPIGEIMIKEST
jgi:LacI family transcriptional regulator